jgi:hypothetical protein
LAAMGTCSSRVAVAVIHVASSSYKGQGRAVAAFLQRVVLDQRVGQHGELVAGM